MLVIQASAWPGPYNRQKGQMKADQEPPGSRTVGGTGTQLTPLSLLERLRANDASAWSRLVSLYAPLVQYWCDRAGLRRMDGEDVTQEVFAAAAANLEGFRRDRPGDTFRGWLRAITRNQILLYFRRTRHQAQAEGGSDAWRLLQQVADQPTETDANEATQMGQLYRRALDQVHCEFEERTWQAFWLTVIEGRTPATLTDELGMSAPSIRQAKSRVLRRLKQELGELLD
jgi:RNA polymerase sigma-70 factor (ECF subfamily)